MLQRLDKSTMRFPFLIGFHMFFLPFHSLSEVSGLVSDCAH